MLSLLLALYGMGYAQESPVNMHMRAQWVSPVLCADVWGDGHFLFGAHYQRWGGPAQVTILDSRFLYLANSRRPEFAVIDLRWLTPDASPFGTISTPTWHVQNVGSSFVHEVYTRNGRLYASAWDSGVWVYDVGNVATQPPRLLGSAPGNSTHSAVC